MHHIDSDRPRGVEKSWPPHGNDSVAMESRDFAVRPVVTLLTDFGSRGGYVAQVKGAILQINPAIQIVDVDHSIAPQDIWSAAWTLASTFAWFPPGTVHIAVVDPGVGTGRNILLAEVNEQRFVLPDNGLLTLVQDRFPELKIYRLDVAKSHLKTISSTFHGRDIMAPIAARWASSGTVPDFASPVESAVRLPIPSVSKTARGWLGGIVFTDHYGNLITNLHRDSVSLPTDERPIFLRIEGNEIEIPVVATYADANPHTPAALLGSGGFWEIAINQGSAAEHFGCEAGATVELVIARDGRTLNPGCLERP